MYKKQKKSWVKHLDFLILDLLCLEVTFYLSCVIRLGNLHNDPGMSEYYNRLAIVLLLMDGCIVFLTEAYTGILRRNRLQSSVFKKGIYHLPSIGLLPLILQLRLVRLLLQDIKDRHGKGVTAEGIHGIVLGLIRPDRPDFRQLFQMEGDRGWCEAKTLCQPLHIHILHHQRLQNVKAGFV